MERSLVWGIATSLALLACGARPTTPQQSMTEALRDDHQAESQYRPHYLHLARGTVEQAQQRHHAYPWPHPVLSIGHNTASFQHYGGSPYFHHGLDIRADAGTDVFASTGGKVVNIENYMPGDAYWEVAILDDDGFLWQYHHVDRDSIPAAIHAAYRSGEPIAAGSKVGEIYYWPVTTFGERYHHVHLNVLGQDGIYLNPFNFLERLPDDQAPEIVEIGLLKNGQHWRQPTITGNYSVYAVIHDLILHDKFVVPPHQISYAVDGNTPVTVWTFDSLPGGASNQRHVNTFFVPSITCGNYTCRRLAVDLSFMPGGKRDFPNTPGPHTLTVTASDVVGNTVSKDFTWTVQ